MKAWFWGTLTTTLFATISVVAADSASSESSAKSVVKTPVPDSNSALRTQNSALETLPNFSLLDYRGKYYELKQADAKVVVLFFTGNGCPIARQSITKIRAARSKAAKQGVIFWMIDSNLQDDRKSIAEEAREFGVGSIPILMDEKQALARMLGVRRTAEAIAISTTNNAIIYRGAIDDQLTEGAKKPAPTENYLQNALVEFLSGVPVTVARTKVSGCLINFPDERKSGETATVSYSKQIAPLLQNKCVNCHSPGNIGPWSMTSYKKVRGMSDMIQEVVLTRRMPPWHADPHIGHFANDRSLTREETALLIDWIAQGAPRGDGPDPLENVAPASSAWALGKPDYIVPLPKKQNVPATGVLEYRYLDSDFEMPEDAWVRAAVSRPDNRRIVHHIIVRIRYPAGHKTKPREEVFFTSWAPGNMSPEFPAGTGKFVPKGSTFNFEMHYNTTGKPEVDQSELGLYLLKEKPKVVFETRVTENRELDIPEKESNAKSFCLYNFKRDAVIYDLIPHMHLRGSWFRYEALYPNGKRELLLSVPKYDFNWQTEYRLTEPKKMPAGTWLLCTGAHDNSAKNPTNPDPTKRVHWGPQSFQEMFMGFMNVAEMASADGKTIEQEQTEETESEESVEK